MGAFRSISLRSTAIGFVIAGILSAVAFAVLFLTKTTTLNPLAPIDSHIFSDYGILVGGLSGSLFTLATILLLIESLNDQRRDFHRTQFENRFFEMVKIQRQNSDEIFLNQREGRRIFITLLREFDACCDVVVALSLEGLDERQKLNIAYLAFFYGAVGETSKKILRLRLQRKYGDIFLVDLLKAFESEQLRLRDKFDYKPFEGHQARLSHYYRHLFQAVCYVDEQPDTLIPQAEKYQYVKLLRAQLSTHEQALLFLNSLSDLGSAWESEVSNRKLITAYNLIKNIPYGFLSNVEPRHFYPAVRYEGIA